MRNNSWVKEAKGLSLIEVLIAVFLLSAVLVPLLNVFLYTAREQQRSGMDSIALNLGRDCLEKGIASGYEELKVKGFGDTYWQTYPGFSDYEYKVTVEEFDHRLEVLKLTVQVRQVDKPDREVILAALVARWP